MLVHNGMHQPYGHWAGKKFIWPIRVYYEDTDMAGHVFHANFLRYAERARSEMIRALHIPPSSLGEKDKIYFVVKRVEIDFLASAYVDDYLEIECDIEKFAATNIIFDQKIKKGKTSIADLRIHLVCMNFLGKITRIPAYIKQRYDNLPSLSFDQNGVIL